MKVFYITNLFSAFWHYLTPKLDKDRLPELANRNVLTDDEMNELAELSESDTFKRLPNLLDIGIKDMDAFIFNLVQGGEIAQAAFESGFYIETISLRLQHIELYLRMFQVFKAKKKTIDSDTDKQTFGSYVNNCKQLGFDNNLILELETFNNFRVKAIHKYILGEIHYSDLKDVCIKTKGLDVKVWQYVFNGNWYFNIVDLIAT